MDGTEQTQSNADGAQGMTLTDFLLARIAEDEAAAMRLPLTSDGRGTIEAKWFALRYESHPDYDPEWKP